MSWQGASGDYVGFTGKIHWIHQFSFVKKILEANPLFFFERRPKVQEKKHVFKKGMAALKLVDACLMTLMTDA